MAYTPTPGMGKLLNEILDDAVKSEELELPYEKELICRMGRIYKILLASGGTLMTLIGIPLCLGESMEVGILCLILATAAWLILPTFISYRCYADKVSIKEEYLILFIKCRKEVLWSDVKYRKIKSGSNESLTLYDKDQKKLISFDGAMVGYNRMLKMAKRSQISQIKK